MRWVRDTWPLLLLAVVLAALAATATIDAERTRSSLALLRQLDCTRAAATRGFLQTDIAARQAEAQRAADASVQLRHYAARLPQDSLLHGYFTWAAGQRDTTASADGLLAAAWQMLPGELGACPR